MLTWGDIVKKVEAAGARPDTPVQEFHIYDDTIDLRIFINAAGELIINEIQMES